MCHFCATDQDTPHNYHGDSEYWIYVPELSGQLSIVFWAVSTLPVCNIVTHIVQQLEAEGYHLWTGINKDNSAGNNHPKSQADGHLLTITNIIHTTNTV